MNSEEQIVISNQHMQTGQPGFWRGLIGNKKLLITAGVLLVVELIWAGYTLTLPVTPAEVFEESSGRSTVPGVVEINYSGASLALDGPASVSLDEKFEVDIILQTPARTDGVDVVITYDPKFLELIPTGVSPAKTTSLYPEYPVNIHDTVNGRITISGAAGVGGVNFTGESKLAAVTFKTKIVGQTKVTIDYTKGSSSDSNVVDSKTGSDILDEVSNLELTINK